MKELNTHLLSISIIVASLVACGSPKTDPKLPQSVSDGSEIKESSSKTDSARTDAKESVAEQQANLRRTIQLRKDQLVRTQQNLARKESIRNALQTRITQSELAVAQNVPGAIRAGGGTGGGDQGTAVATTVITIYSQQQAANKNAATIDGELKSLLGAQALELQKADEGIQALYEQVKGLEDQITDMTLELNKLSGGADTSEDDNDA
jgi:hypothetical protein